MRVTIVVLPERGGAVGALRSHLPLYAGDVPHIAIVTPDGVVPPKFLRRVRG